PSSRGCRPPGAGAEDGGSTRPSSWPVPSPAAGGCPAPRCWPAPRVRPRPAGPATTGSPGSPCGPAALSTRSSRWSWWTTFSPPGRPCAALRRRSARSATGGSAPSPRPGKPDDRDPSDLGLGVVGGHGFCRVVAMATVFDLLDGEWGQLSVSRSAARRLRDVLALAGGAGSLGEVERYVRAAEPVDADRVLLGLVARAVNSD